jgi:hypothetical protein
MSGLTETCIYITIDYTCTICLVLSYYAYLINYIQGAENSMP